MNIHPASSKSWGSEASAHLFELAVSSNFGIAEMVIENKTVLLDLLTVQELQSPDDDNGLSTLFLAIYYDRPDIIRYLYKRGVDLSGYCDPYFNGTALYYAVSFGRFGIVELLQKLGCSLEISCDSFGQTPLKTAEMLENFEMVIVINKLIKNHGTAEDLLSRNCQRYVCWIRYRRKRIATVFVQRVLRGYWGRLKAKAQRKKIKLDIKNLKIHDKKHRNKMV